jgi:Flp pilus assembly pilin Flp
MDDGIRIGVFRFIFMEVESKSFLREEKGQAVVEYIVMVAVVVGIYLSVLTVLKNRKLGNMLTKLVLGPYAAAYQFGHTQAKGFDDGGPKFHPRADGGENNFRLFLNPDSTK